jgi:hypothetical protein
VWALATRSADRDRIALVLSAAGLMWALICLSRFGIAEPTTPRYIYGGAAFMVLLLAALLGPRAITAPRLRVVALVVVGASLTTNIGALRSGAAVLRGHSEQVGASLGAMTQLRGSVPDDFQAAPVASPQIRAAAFFAAADALGSPAWDDARIRAGSPTARAAADEVLRRGGAIAMEGTAPRRAGTDPLTGTVPQDGTLAEGPGPACVTGTPLPGARITVHAAVPAAGLQVRAAPGAGAAAVGVRVARYGDLSVPGDPMAEAPRDGTTLLLQPRLIPGNWRMAATSAGRVVVCRVG